VFDNVFGTRLTRIAAALNDFVGGKTGAEPVHPEHVTDAEADRLARIYRNAATAGTDWCGWDDVPEDEREMTRRGIRAVLGCLPLSRRTQDVMRLAEALRTLLAEGDQNTYGDTPAVIAARRALAAFDQQPAAPAGSATAQLGRPTKAASRADRRLDAIKAWGGPSGSDHDTVINGIEAVHSLLTEILDAQRQSDEAFAAAAAWRKGVAEAAKELERAYRDHRTAPAYRDTALGALAQALEK
jgi:hypothetical protein